MPKQAFGGKKKKKEEEKGLLATEELREKCPERWTETEAGPKAPN